MREKQQDLPIVTEKPKAVRRKKTEEAPVVAVVAPKKKAPAKAKVASVKTGAGKAEMSATQSIESVKPARAKAPARSKLAKEAPAPVAAPAPEKPRPATRAPRKTAKAEAPAPAPQPVAPPPPAPVAVAQAPSQHSAPQHQGHSHGAPQHQEPRRDSGHGGGGDQQGGNFQQRRHGRFRRFSRDRRFGGQERRSDQQQPQQSNEEREYAEDVPLPQDPSKPYVPQFEEGIVEVSGKGFGFLRDPKRNFVQTPQDVFVTPEVVRRHFLRDGQWIKGEVRRGSRGLQLFKLTEINGEDPEKFRNLPMFEELTTINPCKRIKLETTSDRYTTRVIDLMTPIGKGQRGLIVAPPRTGKTTLLQHIGEAVVKNYPQMKLIILLVDERPEEVTEIRRSVPDAEIMASSNDNDVKSHTRIAQLAIERAKRLVEAGQDVFVLLDSITRMGRAFNNAMTNTGRTLSGGLDARAMEVPRRLFAAARNTEEAGSLTILGTALIETGSKMDELIFQEFKGTGNMDLVLDRKISDQRIYPAVDIFQSGTRREELLVPPDELEKTNVIRRGLAGHKPVEAIDRLLMFLKRFPTNIEMLRGIPAER